MKLRTLIAMLVVALAAAGSAQMEPVPDEMKSVAWLVGTWEGDVTMSFGGQESKSKSKMVYEMVLGGRYIRSINTYEMEGMGEMVGQLMMTFNSQSKKWMSWWCDSASADMMEMSGTHESGAYVSVSKPTPMMGENVVIRSTMKKVTDTHLSFKLEMQQGDDWVTMMSGDYKKKPAMGSK